MYFGRLGNPVPVSPTPFGAGVYGRYVVHSLTAVDFISMVVTGGLSVSASAWVCAAVLWTSGTLVQVQAAGNRPVFGDSTPVMYSSPLLDDSYNASAEFNPRGVEYLYYLTNAFLDAIQRDDTAALGELDPDRNWITVTLAGGPEPDMGLWWGSMESRIAKSIWLIGKTRGLGKCLPPGLALLQDRRPCFLFRRDR